MNKPKDQTDIDKLREAVATAEGSMSIGGGVRELLDATVEFAAAIDARVAKIEAAATAKKR